jgi:PIN domain nuclease of toxin-antitoxin system
VSAYLLDTNALLWLGLDDTALLPSARRILFDAPLFVSIASAIEIAIKASIGKLALPDPFATDFEVAFASMIGREGVDLLPFDLSFVDRLRDLPLHHRDPFDRIIIAQALSLGLTVATRDRAFRLYEGLEILDI